MYLNKKHGHDLADVAALVGEFCHRPFHLQCGTLESRVRKKLFGKFTHWLLVGNHGRTGREKGESGSTYGSRMDLV